MNREIKFRAWDRESKRLFNIARFDFADYTVYSHLFACEGYLGENLDIMQFTGLKDKAGTEIYEGDVLKRIVTIKVFGSDLPSEDVEDIVTVEWRDDYAGFYIGERVLFAEIDATHCSHTGCRCTKFEVIGNIYENPNLLEESN